VPTSLIPHLEPAVHSTLDEKNGWGYEQQRAAWLDTFGQFAGPCGACTWDHVHCAPNTPGGPSPHSPPELHADGCNAPLAVAAARAVKEVGGG